MYVAEVLKAGGFVAKIALFDAEAVHVSGSRLSDSGAFRYVASPDDTCPDHLVELIWSDLQRARLHGGSGGYTWALSK
jgi:hypothetical protein